jgi:hypothetical protein
MRADSARSVIDFACPLPTMRRQRRVFKSVSDISPIGGEQITVMADCQRFESDFA